MESPTKKTYNDVMASLTADAPQYGSALAKHGRRANGPFGSRAEPAAKPVAPPEPPITSSFKASPTHGIAIGAEDHYASYHETPEQLAAKYLAEQRPLAERYRAKNPGQPFMQDIGEYSFNHVSPVVVQQFKPGSKHLSAQYNQYSDQIQMASDPLTMRADPYTGTRTSDVLQHELTHAQQRSKLPEVYLPDKNILPYYQKQKDPYYMYRARREESEAYAVPMKRQQWLSEELNKARGKPSVPLQTEQNWRDLYKNAPDRFEQLMDGIHPEKKQDYFDKVLLPMLQGLVQNNGNGNMKNANDATKLNATSAPQYKPSALSKNGRKADGLLWSTAPAAKPVAPPVPSPTNPYGSAPGTSGERKETTKYPYQNLKDYLAQFPEPAVKSRFISSPNAGIEIGAADHYGPDHATKHQLAAKYLAEQRPLAEQYRAANPEQTFMQDISEESFDRKLPVIVQAFNDNLKRVNGDYLPDVDRIRMAADPRPLYGVNPNTGDRTAETFQHELTHAQQRSKLPTELLPDKNILPYYQNHKDPNSLYLARRHETEARVVPTRRRLWLDEELNKARGNPPAPLQTEQSWKDLYNSAPDKFEGLLQNIHPAKRQDYFNKILLPMLQGLVQNNGNTNMKNANDATTKMAELRKRAGVWGKLGKLAGPAKGVGLVGAAGGVAYGVNKWGAKADADMRAETDKLLSDPDTFTLGEQAAKTVNTEREKVNNPSAVEGPGDSWMTVGLPVGITSLASLLIYNMLKNKVDPDTQDFN